MSTGGGGGAEQMLAMAAALERQGRTSEAILAYEKLLEVWPGLPDAWYNLGRLQRQMGQFPRALACYQEALERLVTQPEEVHLNRGVIFSDCLNQYDAAELELKKALELNPAYVPALMNYANLHEDLGRREPAAAMYERVLELDPGSAAALARYAGLKNFSDAQDPIIGRLRMAVEQPGISAADRAAVEFALGRALDACGAYDDAFHTYRQANRHSRESAPPNTGYYDLAQAEAYTERLIRTDRPMGGFGGADTLTTGAPPQEALLPAVPAPIFVCGMFRSGSTLLEQLLAGHPSITAGGELDFLPRAVASELAPFPEGFASISAASLNRLAAEYRAMLAERFPHALNVTDKRPDNFLYIGLIKTLFPQAKIVHSVRDALDNCLSIYFLHLDQGMSYALDLMDIGHHYRQYLRLMSHWKAHFGADIIDVSYDALILNPKSELERVLSCLGFAWDERCASVPALGRAIKTASVWQVRAPLHARSSGRARHYAKQLRELQEYIESPL